MYHTDIRAAGPRHQNWWRSVLMTPLPSTPLGTRVNSTKLLWLITHLLMNRMIQRTKQGMFWKEKKCLDLPFELTNYTILLLIVFRESSICIEYHRRYERIHSKLWNCCKAVARYPHQTNRYCSQHQPRTHSRGSGTTALCRYLRNGRRRWTQSGAWR